MPRPSMAMAQRQRSAAPYMSSSRQCSSTRSEARRNASSAHGSPSCTERHASTSMGTPAVAPAMSIPSAKRSP